MDIKLVYINSDGRKQEIFIPHATIKLELTMFGPEHIKAKITVKCDNPIMKVNGSIEGVITQDKITQVITNKAIEIIIREERKDGFEGWSYKWHIETIKPLKEVVS